MKEIKLLLKLWTGSFMMHGIVYRTLFVLAASAAIAAAIYAHYYEGFGWPASYLIGAAVSFVLSIPTAVIGMKELKDVKRWNYLYDRVIK